MTEHQQPGGSRRILFVVAVGGLSGAPMYALRKVRWLTANGWEVTVACPSETAASEFREAGATFEIVKQLRHTLFTASATERAESADVLGAIIARDCIEIIEADTPRAAEHAEQVSRITGVPLWVMVIGPHFDGRRYRSLVNGWVRDGRLGVMHEEGAARLARGHRFDPDACPVLPLPVDGLRFGGDPADVASLRDELGLDASRPVVVSVSRLSPGKAYLAELVRAMDRLHATTGAQLVIVGHGSWRKDLAELGPRLGDDLHFTGQRDDLERFYAVADVYVGVGTTIIEAATVGAPPLVATRPPHERESPGTFGPATRFSFGQPIAGLDYRPLADRLEELLADPTLAQRSAVEATDAATAMYSTDAVMARQVEIYERLLEHTPWPTEAAPMGSFAPKTGLERRVRRRWEALPGRVRSRVARVWAASR